MERDFKKISIRGRLAFGAFCLENAINACGFADSALSQKVLPVIWNFTISEELDKWDESIRKVDPLLLADDPLLDAQLAQLYRTLPVFITNMISEVIEIGTANLYGGTGEYSSFSLNPLLRLVELCKKHNVSMPPIDRFAESRFSEEHGWGYPRNRSSFIP